MVDQALIHEKVSGREIVDRIEAAEALRDIFNLLPNKDAAWQDLVICNKKHQKG